jgi:hypothetical protein
MANARASATPLVLYPRLPAILSPPREIDPAFLDIERQPPRKQKRRPNKARRIGRAFCCIRVAFLFSVWAFERLFFAVWAVPFGLPSATRSLSLTVIFQKNISAFQAFLRQGVKVSHSVLLYSLKKHK